MAPSGDGQTSPVGMSEALGCICRAVVVNGGYWASEIQTSPDDGSRLPGTGCATATSGNAIETMRAKPAVGCREDMGASTSGADISV
jgi:hypothetical protein